MTRELIGRRVRLSQDKDVFPTGIFRQGQTGTIKHIDKELVSVEMDEVHEALRHWANQLHWYRDDGPRGCVLVEEFLKEVELL